MVHTQQSDNTLPFPDRRRPSTRQAVAVAGATSGSAQGGGEQSPNPLALALQLSKLLQTSLELNTVLGLFFQQLQQHLAIDDLQYHHPSVSQPIQFGNSGRHRCQYQLEVEQTAIGSLSLGRDKRLQDDELKLLENMLSCLVCPLRNALLYRQALQSALQDPLTGLGNRSALDNALKRELSIAKRHQQALALLVIDLDHFKAINDQHGHSVGDQVLKQAAGHLIDCCRDADACYRFGGEEFVVILSRTELAGAEIMAERIRRCLQGTTTAELPPFTASIGVTAMREGDDMELLFSRADQAMYRAKQNGRNQVVIGY